MKPKVSPDLLPSSAPPRRDSAVVPKNVSGPGLTSGLRAAVRPPLPPRPPALPRPLPARKPEDLADLFDDADATNQVTAVESVSAQLVSASRDDAVEGLVWRDDPPTKETPVDTQAVLRAVAAEGLPSPVADDDTPMRAALPTPAMPATPTPVKAMPSMFARPAPTPRMEQVRVPPPPPLPTVRQHALAAPNAAPVATPARPMTPPQFPAMRPSGIFGAGHTELPAFEALPDLPPSLLPPPAYRSSAPSLPPPPSSSLAALSASIPPAMASSPSFVSGVPSSRRPMERGMTGSFPLPHPVARGAYRRAFEMDRAPSTWLRKLTIVGVAVLIAATFVGLAHVITGGAIWAP